MVRFSRIAVFALATAAVLFALPASARVYKFVDRTNPVAFFYADCGQDPRGWSIERISSECKRVEPSAIASFSELQGITTKVDVVEY